MKYSSRVLVSVSILAALAAAPALFAAEITLNIQAERWELKPGLTTVAWTYNGQVPGTPIVVQKGEKVVVLATNKLMVPTNIHWHGLEVPNDQDGPAIEIPPGGRFRYEFVVRESGTYWYHTHQRPVLPQLDRGLYGAFIVKTEEDSRYSGDHVLVLDDWYLDANGRRLEGTARGDMERYGNLETVNGKTGSAIEPLVFQRGERHKLRFINASTAAVHTVRITGHTFQVTHTDGHPLSAPYGTDTLILQPGERLDVEVAAVGNAGSEWAITSDRPELGMRIPISYKTGAQAQMSSPFVPPSPHGLPGIREKVPNAMLDLNSSTSMGGMSMGGMSMGGMSMGGSSDSGGRAMDMGEMSGMSMGGDASGMKRWTINGKAFPDTEPIFVKTGEVVKLRIRNSDTQMMHPMDHPIHIHGTYFQVVSLNGADPARETWKDTINVPAGQFVDIAFVMKNPGQWMLHCHIIDHEDGGMVTVIEAR